MERLRKKLMFVAAIFAAVSLLFVFSCGGGDGDPADPGNQGDPNGPGDQGDPNDPGNNNGGDDDKYDITRIIFVPDSGAETEWIGKPEDKCSPEPDQGVDETESKLEKWGKILDAPIGSFLRVQIRKSPTDNSVDTEGRDWLHISFYTFDFDGSNWNDVGWVLLQSEEDSPLTFTGNDPLTVDFLLHDDEDNHKLINGPGVNAFNMYANNGYEFYKELELHTPKDN